MIHLNGHKICVVDCETTGTEAGHNDLIQICVLPLDYNLMPDDRYIPFEMKLKPRRPENVDPNAMTVHKQTLHDIMAYGMDPDIAADLFDEWVARLGLPENKRICPMGQNLGFDIPFVKDWLGPLNFALHFDGRIRDTQTVSLFINDLRDSKAERVPFGRNGLRNLCTYLDIEWDEDMAHDAVYDCHKTAEVYRTLMKRSNYI